MKPRIAIVSNYGAGGSLLYWQQLAAALDRKNYAVVHYLPENAGPLARDSDLYRPVLKDPSTSPAFLKARGIKYPYHLLKYLGNALALKPERHLRAAHLLFPFYLSDWITVERLQRMGLRVVLTVHEALPHKAFLGGGADRRLLKRMFRRADLLFVHDDSIVHELVNLYAINPVRIKVIPHGYFDMPESSADMLALKKKYHVPLDKKVLLFFGTIRENKGLDILIQAMTGLKKDFFLLIAGDSAGSIETPVEHYERMIRGANLSGSVHWMKRYISDEDASEIFRIADAIVLPYKKSYRAQSGVLHLSIGHERPCIVSDIGAISETVRNYDLGLSVAPEDADALREGVLSLFEKLNKKYTFDFKGFKKDNSWDKIADKIISAYEDLCLGLE